MSRSHSPQSTVGSPQTRHRGPWTADRRHTGGLWSGGFTLLELMVTVAIASLGMVLIYEAFFSSLDTLTLASERLNAVEWSEKVMWETQDKLNRSGLLAAGDEEGQLQIGNKNFNWISQVYPVSTSSNGGHLAEGNNLYQMDLRLTWKTGRRNAVFRKSSYHMPRARSQL